MLEANNNGIVNAFQICINDVNVYEVLSIFNQKMKSAGIILNPISHRVAIDLQKYGF